MKSNMKFYNLDEKEVRFQLSMCFVLIAFVLGVGFNLDSRLRERYVTQNYISKKFYWDFLFKEGDIFSNGNSYWDNIIDKEYVNQHKLEIEHYELEKKRLDLEMKDSTKSFLKYSYPVFPGSVESRRDSLIIGVKEQFLLIIKIAFFAIIIIVTAGRKSIEYLKNKKNYTHLYEVVIQNSLDKIDNSINLTPLGLLPNRDNQELVKSSEYIGPYPLEHPLNSKKLRTRFSSFVLAEALRYKGRDISVVNMSSEENRYFFVHEYKYPSEGSFLSFCWIDLYCGNDGEEIQQIQWKINYIALFGGVNPAFVTGWKEDRDEFLENFVRNCSANAVMQINREMNIQPLNVGSCQEPTMKLSNDHKSNWD